MISKEERERLRDTIDPRIQLCYDYILIISEDRMLATYGGNISLVTFDAELIFTADSIYIPEYPSGTKIDSDGNLEATYDFIDDYLIYVDNGKKGLIDYDGGIILQANYTNITFNDKQQAEILP